MSARLWHSLPYVFDHLDVEERRASVPACLPGYCRHPMRADGSAPPVLRARRRAAWARWMSTNASAIHSNTSSRLWSLRDCMGGVDCSEPGEWWPTSRSDRATGGRRTPRSTCGAARTPRLNATRLLKRRRLPWRRAIESYCSDGSDLAAPSPAVRAACCGRGLALPHETRWWGPSASSARLLDTLSRSFWPRAAAPSAFLHVRTFGQGDFVARKQQLRGFGLALQPHATQQAQDPDRLLLASPVPSVYDVSLPRDREIPRANGHSDPQCRP